MDWLRNTVSAAERVVSRSSAGLSAARRGQLRPRSFTSGPDREAPTDRRASMDQAPCLEDLPGASAALPIRRRQRSSSISTASARSVERSEAALAYTAARPHARDIKCVRCFDQNVTFADPELSRLFRQWFALYQSGSEQLEVMQDQYRLLFAYVEAFNQRYQVAVLPPDEAELCTVSRRPDGDSSDEHGHPSYAVISAVNALDDMVTVFCDAILQATPEVTAVADDLLTLLYHIEILSRWSGNRRRMTRHQLAEVLLRLLLTVVATYKRWTLSGELSSEVVDDSRSVADRTVHTRTYSMISVSSLRSWVAESPKSVDEEYRAPCTIELTSAEREIMERLITLLCLVMQRLADPADAWLGHLRDWKTPPSGVQDDNIWVLLSARRTRDFYHDLIRSLQHFMLHLQRDNAPEMTQLQMHAYMQTLHL
ncbi:hypothetical protein THASP1DRAFT_30854, partial [Thamnocephalis sphaerospora]